jgi:hypothetical protein
MAPSAPSASSSATARDPIAFHDVLSDDGTRLRAYRVA